MLMNKLNDHTLLVRLITFLLYKPSNLTLGDLTQRNENLCSQKKKVHFNFFQNSPKLEKT